MKDEKSLHSICRWTFHSGQGGFVPDNIRPDWGLEKFTTVDMIQLVKQNIVPKLPDDIELGIELHYDNEVNEKTALETTDALVDSGIYLAMITPGAHIHFGYGGRASLDPNELKLANEFGKRTVDLAYGSLKKAWHPDPQKVPTLVLWNGSFGYDIVSIGIRKMYQNLKQSVAELCRYEAQKGGDLYIGIEPKPNEGHPALLIPTVSSALYFWERLKEEFGVSLEKKGVNKEFGHSDMIGLDPVYDSVEELDNNAMVHVHLNSQGYNDGLSPGGPGKYDIDFGTKINGFNIAIAGLIHQAGYDRWKGHDMQARPYDNEVQAIDRVVRSIFSWEACRKAAVELDTNQLMKHLSARETAQAEDMMRSMVMSANMYFNQMYAN
jgi:xylose isomerase